MCRKKNAPTTPFLAWSAESPTLLLLDRLGTSGYFEAAISQTPPMLILPL